MKLFIAVIMAFGTLISVSAQSSDTKVAYIKGDKVNMRATPSTSGKVLAKAQQGDLFYVNEIKNGWIKTVIEGMDEDEVYYISSSVVEIFPAVGFPKDKLNSTFSFSDGDTVGYLTFEPQQNGAVQYDYVLKSKEIMKMGGSGIVASGSDTVYYDAETGTLYQPSEWSSNTESSYQQAVYDPATGRLIYAGFMWQEEK